MNLIQIFEELCKNPYFNAGFGLIGVGTALAISKVGWRQATAFGRRHFLASLEIPSRDRSFYWVLQWITNQHVVGINSALRSQHLSVQTTVHQFESGRFETRFFYVCFDKMLQCFVYYFDFYMLSGLGDCIEFCSI